MHEYLVLPGPSANRVYAAQAPRLAAAELEDLLDALTDDGVDATVLELAGVAYVSVVAPAPLTGPALRALWAASTTFAVFERAGELLRPVPREQVERHAGDLVTIQKYQGKTNEQWTRLLLSVTAAATARPQALLDGSLQVLDPMCGRGTTLNVALLLGLDATGIDLDRRDLEEYERFVKTWLRTHRYKHTARTGHLRTHGTHRGRRLDVTFAASKEDQRAGREQHLSYLGTDTTDLGGLVRAGQFDVVVTDTPYGVQHGSHGDRLARSPLAVLEAALPGWVRALRPGGAVGLSYNRHVAAPAELAALLEGNGLDVVGDPQDERFRHRVDAAIDRDLLVARRPGGTGAGAAPAGR